MDLGATVCTPKRPSCLVCPLQGTCEAHALGVEAELPYRDAKPDRPIRRGIAFLAVTDDGKVLLRQRPDTGLLARMLEVPSTEWVEGTPPGFRSRAHRACQARLVAGAGDRRPHVHPFPPRNRGLSRRHSGRGIADLLGR